MIRIALAAAAMGGSTAASAHGGHGHAGWTFDPWVTLPLALLLIVYLVGSVRLSRRSTRPPRSPALFLGGWSVLTLSLVSPLHEAGERSFTLHMIEHELIMLVATFLLAASGSGGILAWGLPARARQCLYEKRPGDQFVIALGKQQEGKWAFKDLFTFSRVK